MKINTQQDLQLFFKTHYRNGVIQANRIVPDQSEAEDIVQECLIKLWDHRAKANATSPVGYFKKMVRNKCIDYLRKQKWETVELQPNQVGQLDHSKLEQMELEAKINATIDSLPDRCREVFMLSRFEEMSYKEIAATLSISPKTVENQISKALKVLSASLTFTLILLFFIWT